MSQFSQGLSSMDSRRWNHDEYCNDERTGSESADKSQQHPAPRDSYHSPDHLQQQLQPRDHLQQQLLQQHQSFNLLQQQHQPQESYRGLDHLKDQPRESNKSPNHLQKLHQHQEGNQSSDHVKKQNQRRENYQSSDPRETQHQPRDRSPDPLQKQHQPRYRSPDPLKFQHQPPERYQSPDHLQTQQQPPSGYTSPVHLRKQQQPRESYQSPTYHLEKQQKPREHYPILDHLQEQDQHAVSNHHKVTERIYRSPEHRGRPPVIVVPDQPPSVIDYPKVDDHPSGHPSPHSQTPWVKAPPTHNRTKEGNTASESTVQATHDQVPMNPKPLLPLYHEERAMNTADDSDKNVRLTRPHKKSPPKPCCQS